MVDYFINGHINLNRMSSIQTRIGLLTYTDDASKKTNYAIDDESFTIQSNLL